MVLYVAKLKHKQKVWFGKFKGWIKESIESVVIIKEKLWEKMREVQKAYLRLMRLRIKLKWEKRVYGPESQQTEEKEKIF